MTGAVLRVFWTLSPASCPYFPLYCCAYLCIRIGPFAKPWLPFFLLPRMTKKRGVLEISRSYRTPNMFIPRRSFLLTMGDLQDQCCCQRPSKSIQSDTNNAVGAASAATQEELAKEAETGAGGRGGLVLMGPALIPQDLRYLVVYVFSAEGLPGFSSVGVPAVNALVQV